MKIAEVLAGKPKSIVTLWTNHTVADAVRLFNQRNVSSVVIIDPSDRPLGLVTDRDVVRAVATRGAEALDLNITRVMKAPPPYCAPSITVSEALRRMTDDRNRHFVVMDKEQMLGVVSIGDLVKVRLDDAEVEGRVLREIAFGHMSAGE